MLFYLILKLNKNVSAYSETVCWTQPSIIRFAPDPDLPSAASERSRRVGVWPRLLPLLALLILPVRVNGIIDRAWCAS